MPPKTPTILFVFIMSGDELWDGTQFDFILDPILRKNITKAAWISLKQDIVRARCSTYERVDRPIQVNR